MELEYNKVTNMCVAAVLDPCIKHMSFSRLLNSFQRGNLTPEKAISFARTEFEWRYKPEQEPTPTPTHPPPTRKDKALETKRKLASLTGTSLSVVEASTTYQTEFDRYMS